MSDLIIGLAQINTSVGDLRGNRDRIIEMIQRAESKNLDLICFPELCVSGYPPEDLLLNTEFLAANTRSLEEIALITGDTVCVVGFIDTDEDVFNAAAVLHRGKILEIYHKVLLPNYGVFDENRYFGSGKNNMVIKIRGVKIGVTVCEDIWFAGGPMEEAITYGGAEVILNLSSSPFHRGKQLERERLLKARAHDGNVVIAYTNAVGGQDELIFDGRSLIYDPVNGRIACAKAFEEDLLISEISTAPIRARRSLQPLHRYARFSCSGRYTKKVTVEHSAKSSIEANERVAFTSPGTCLGEDAVSHADPMEDIYKALCLSLCDYFRKNKISDAVIGISGGIDSALVAAIAVKALGPERVHGVYMPSEYTTELSRECAETVSKRLGIEMLTLPIFDMVRVFTDSAEFLGGEGIALENLQARIRGVLLMALSNRYGWLVLTTGNKSEMAMGYCTMYGDMAGGFAPISDLLKRDVYKLSDFINKHEGKAVIPKEIIEREPTAELKENQKDSDTLPPYEILDAILESWIEEGKSIEDIVKSGYEEDLIRDIISRIEASEYKRRQAPPGTKITQRAFGRDWRMPVSNAFLKYS